MEVDATDVLLARNNQTSFFNALKLIDLSTAEGSYRRQTVGDAAYYESLAAINHALASVATQRPAEKDVAAEAVDKLLATYWL